MAKPLVKRRMAWEKQFLRAIENGYPEKTAANLAGVGTGDVRNWAKRSQGFAEAYDASKARAVPRPRR